LLLLPLALVPGLLSIFAIPKQSVLIALAAVLLFALARLERGWPLERPVTWAFFACLAVDFAAFALSFDPLGAMLGPYNFRLGLATHLALAVLFVAAATLVRSTPDVEWLLVRGAPALAVVLAYAVFQRAGLDPVDYATDTRSNVVSTLGNRNDMAAFALLALIFAWPLMRSAGRHWPGWRWRGIGAPEIAAAGVFLAVETLVILSLSRGAILGLVLALAVLCLAAWHRLGLRQALRTGSAITALMVVGMLPHMATGDLWDALGRFGDSGAAVSGKDEADGTGLRRGLWVGTVALLADRPLLGVGQSGFGEAFDRSRPADLGEAWDSSDPAAPQRSFTSPHNAALEVAANAGVLGLAAVASIIALLGRSVWTIYRSEEPALAAFIAASFAGYAAATAFNPFYIGTLSVMAVLLGIVAGVSAGPPAAEPSRAAARAWAVIRPASAAGLGFAVLFAAGQVFLDREYGQIAKRGVVGANELDTLRRISLLMPVEKVYRGAHVQSLQAVGVATADRQLVADAYERHQAYLRDFPGTGADFVRLAELRLMLGEPGIEDALEKAREADPHGVRTAASIQRVEAAIEALDARR
jgi:hypothetical protein